MTHLAQQRIDFIALLHETFVIDKGFGAYAYLSVNEVMDLFEKFLDSHESAKSYIKKYVRSIRG